MPVTGVRQRDRVYKPPILESAWVVLPRKSNGCLSVYRWWILFVFTAPVPFGREPQKSARKLECCCVQISVSSGHLVSGLLSLGICAATWGVDEENRCVLWCGHFIECSGMCL